MLKFLKRQGVHAGIWFLEFQSRGAPHFHAFLGAYPVGGVNAVARAWHRIVGTQDENTICGIWVNCQVVRVSNICAFPTQPALTPLNTLLNRSKQVPAEFSAVGRFWGCWGDARPVWRYICGRGRYSRETAGLAILRHRAQFSNTEQLDQWARRAYFSCTMWGAATSLDDLLSSVAWCPF